MIGAPLWCGGGGEKMSIKTTTTWGETQAKRLGEDYDDLRERLRVVEVADYNGIMRAKGEGRGNRLTSAPSGRVTPVPRDDDGAAGVAADIAAERDEAREAARELEGERDAAIEALVACEGAVDGLTDIVERLIAELDDLRAKFSEADQQVQELQEELEEVRNG